jgi:Amt family ammonium transporter
MNPDYTFPLFQMMFAANQPPLPVGAMAERTRYSAYLIGVRWSSARVYLTRQQSERNLWRSGLVSRNGLCIDFAGRPWCTASVLGVRHGIICWGRVHRLVADGTPRSIPSHNLSLVFGGFILCRLVLASMPAVAWE